MFWHFLLHVSEHVINLYAVLEMIMNISTVDVFVQEVSSMLVEALDNHSFVGEASQFLIHLVIGPFEFNITYFDQQVAGEVSQENFLPGLVF